MKKILLLLASLSMVCLTGCGIVSAEDEEVTYNYSYLTYCDGPMGHETDDCYDVGGPTYITIKGDYSNGNRVTVVADFGPNGIISDVYTSYGVKADGYLELANSNDRMIIYSDYAYVVGSTYYWSFSNYYGLYKK